MKEMLCPYCGERVYGGFFWIWRCSTHGKVSPIEREIPNVNIKVIEQDKTKKEEEEKK